MKTQGQERPGHKYVKREMRNGEWRYWYAEDLEAKQVEEGRAVELGAHDGKPAKRFVGIQVTENAVVLKDQDTGQLRTFSHAQWNELVQTHLKNKPTRNEARRQEYLTSGTTRQSADKKVGLTQGQQMQRQGASGTNRAAAMMAHGKQPVSIPGQADKPAARQATAAPTTTAAAPATPSTPPPAADVAAAALQMRRALVAAGHYLQAKQLDKVIANLGMNPKGLGRGRPVGTTYDVRTLRQWEGQRQQLLASHEKASDAVKPDLVPAIDRLSSKMNALAEKLGEDSRYELLTPKAPAKMGRPSLPAEYVAFRDSLPKGELRKMSADQVKAAFAKHQEGAKFKAQLAASAKPAAPAAPKPPAAPAKTADFVPVETKSKEDTPEPTDAPATPKVRQWTSALELPAGTHKLEKDGTSFEVHVPSQEGAQGHVTVFGADGVPVAKHKFEYNGFTAPAVKVALEKARLATPTKEAPAAAPEKEYRKVTDPAELKDFHRQFIQTEQGEPHSKKVKAAMQRVQELTERSQTGSKEHRAKVLKDLHKAKQDKQYAVEDMLTAMHKHYNQVGWPDQEPAAATPEPPAAAAPDTPAPTAPAAPATTPAPAATKKPTKPAAPARKEQAAVKLRAMEAVYGEHLDQMDALAKEGKDPKAYQELSTKAEQIKETIQDHEREHGVESAVIGRKPVAASWGKKAGANPDATAQARGYATPEDIAQGANKFFNRDQVQKRLSAITTVHASPTTESNGKHRVLIPAFVDAKGTPAQLNIGGADTAFDDSEQAARFAAILSHVGVPALSAEADLTPAEKKHFQDKTKEAIGNNREFLTKMAEVVRAPEKVTTLDAKHWASLNADTVRIKRSSHPDYTNHHESIKKVIDDVDQGRLVHDVASSQVKPKTLDAIKQHLPEEAQEELQNTIEGVPTNDPKYASDDHEAIHSAKPTNRVRSLLTWLSHAAGEVGEQAKAALKKHGAALAAALAIGGAFAPGQAEAMDPMQQEAPAQDWREKLAGFAAVTGLGAAALRKKKEDKGLPEEPEPLPPPEHQPQVSENGRQQEEDALVAAWRWGELPASFGAPLQDPPPIPDTLVQGTGFTPAAVAAAAPAAAPSTATPPAGAIPPKTKKLPKFQADPAKAQALVAQWEQQAKQKVGTDKATADQMVADWQKKAEEQVGAWQQTAKQRWNISPDLAASPDQGKTREEKEKKISEKMEKDKQFLEDKTGKNWRRVVAETMWQPGDKPLPDYDPKKDAANKEKQAALLTRSKT